MFATTADCNAINSNASGRPAEALVRPAICDFAQERACISTFAVNAVQRQHKYNLKYKIQRQEYTIYVQFVIARHVHTFYGSRAGVEMLDKNVDRHWTVLIQCRNTSYKKTAAVSGDLFLESH